jgi:hypothetical protein
MHTIYSLSRVILHAQLYPHPHEYPARSIHYYQTGTARLALCTAISEPVPSMRCGNVSTPHTAPSAPVRSFIFPLNRLSKSASWWKSSPHEPDAKAISGVFHLYSFFSFCENSERCAETSVSPAIPPRTNFPQHVRTSLVMARLSGRR